MLEADPRAGRSRGWPRTPPACRLAPAAPSGTATGTPAEDRPAMRRAFLFPLLMSLSRAGRHLYRRSLAWSRQELGAAQSGPNWSHLSHLEPADTPPLRNVEGR